MSSFENTLERMKSLYTYGKEINESNRASVHTLEHSAKAADGKTYGIIRECNKYYIKAATKGKETIAESYNYIGGVCNKRDYEYTSYSNALKNFEMKMASINEAFDSKVNISTLDPFKKGDFLIECTEEMKNQIARQRQIMYNASMLMNEATEIGASRKDDVVMFDGKNPEANTGKKGCEDYKNTNANPEYAGSKTNGVDKKVAPFNTNTTKCEDQLKENCECGSESCDCNNDWASKGIGKGRDPKQVGWDIDGQHTVNEEEDWASKGLPSTPGVGEADTDHNNMPFDKTVNEDEEFDSEMDVESDDVDFESEEGADFDMEGDEEDFDMEDDEESFDMEGDEEDFDMEGDEESFDMGDDAEMGENNDILAQIEDLQAQLDALKSQLNSEESLDAVADDEADFDMESDEEPVDVEDDEEDFDMEGDEESFDMGDDEESFDVEGEDELDAELDSEPEDGEFEENDEEDMLAESKRIAMNNIIESVVNKILNEDELHAFGKHPGYQKKPMELPSTGEDKNQWGEDWNDESVYSEQPFGTKIGSSAPFDKVVNDITKKVMNKLAEAVNGEKKEKPSCPVTQKACYDIASKTPKKKSEVSERKVLKLNNSEAPSMEEPQNTPMDGASAAPSQDPNQQIDMTDSDSSMMANTGDNDPMMDDNMGGEESMETSMTMGDDMGNEDPMMNGEDTPMDSPMDGEDEGDDSTTSIINQLSPEDREAVRAYAQSMLSKSDGLNDETQQEPMMESFVFTKKQLTKIMESFRQSEIKKDEKPLNKKYSKSVSKKSPFNSPNFKK